MRELHIAPSLRELSPRELVAALKHGRAFVDNDGRVLPVLRGGADWPQVQSAQQLASYGMVSSGGTSVTAGNSNAKGSWTQLVASTTTDIHALFVILLSVSVQQFRVDVGYGAAAAEYVVVPDLLVFQVSDVGQKTIVYGPIPAHIPGGSRLAARAANSGASATNTLQVAVIGVSA